jgi:hypothetical protein
VTSATRAQVNRAERRPNVLGSTFTATPNRQSRPANRCAPVPSHGATGAVSRGSG